MATHEKSIDVNVPINTAYNQWTQFEQFPQFMEGVREVKQLDDKRLHWRADIAGREKEWDAEITEQVPDKQVAWKSTSGAENNGTVSFQSIDPSTTRVTLRLEYQPEGPLESVGDALGFVSRRVDNDLDNFKEFIESQGHETGAWRGEIHQGQVQGPSGQSGQMGGSMSGQSTSGPSQGQMRNVSQPGLGSQGSVSSNEQSIEVHVPLSTAYNQWTQFEQFPQFMEGVREIEQIDDKRLHWRAELGGREKEWDAEITEQTPDKEIVWQSTSGAPNSGKVAFQAIDPNTTRVTLRLAYEPEGPAEVIGDKLGFVSRQVGNDLKQFKEYIESKGRETGAWRGEIHGGQVQSSGPTGNTGYSGGPSSAGGISGQSTQPGMDARQQDRRGWPIEDICEDRPNQGDEE